MIELSRAFVVAADTQSRLRGSDVESRLFQSFAERGHYGGREFITRQGTYFCSPGGRLLASIGPAEPADMLAAMELALQEWEMLRDAQRRLPPGTDLGPAPPYLAVHPVDGLVLSVFSRDLSEIPPDYELPRTSVGPRWWNLDHGWFSREEAREWLPVEPREGVRHDVPAALVDRVVCLHLLDGVSGYLPRRFRPEEIVRSGTRITSEVVELRGPLVRIRLEGVTRAHAPERKLAASPEEIETRLLGHATYDREKELFVDFEVVAVGTRSGTVERDTGSPAEPKGIGFVLSLEPPDHAIVPPHFLHRYDAEWARACIRSP